MSHLDFEDVDRGKWFYLVESYKKSLPIAQTRHGLSSPVTVSLTSYRPRFEYLHLTIKSILEQVVTPDRVVLWISRDDKEYLPPEILALSSTVSVKFCDDTGPYKKLVESIIAYPRDYIVTADDDAYYHRYWLKTLLEEVDEDRCEILCHIADRIHYSGNRIASSNEWTKDVQDAASRTASTDLVPIGLGGVLYPPASLHKGVLDRETFLRLAPYSDDFWFHVMARLNDVPARKVGKRLIQVMWPRTQKVALWRSNLVHRNDKALFELLRVYGESVFNGACGIDRVSFY